MRSYETLKSILKLRANSGPVVFYFFKSRSRYFSSLFPNKMFLFTQVCRVRLTSTLITFIGPEHVNSKCHKLEIIA